MQTVFCSPAMALSSKAQISQGFRQAASPARLAARPVLLKSAVAFRDDDRTQVGRLTGTANIALSSCAKNSWLYDYRLLLGGCRQLA